MEFIWPRLSVFLQEYVDINPGGVGAQIFPQSSFRGFSVVHADVRGANMTSCLPLPSNSPGAH